MTLTPLKKKSIARKLDNQDIGCWQKESLPIVVTVDDYDGVGSLFFIFIKSTEYLVNPVSSIQYLGRLPAQRFVQIIWPDCKPKDEV